MTEKELTLLPESKALELLPGGDFFSGYKYATPYNFSVIVNSVGCWAVSSCWGTGEHDKAQRYCDNCATNPLFTSSDFTLYAPWSSFTAASVENWLTATLDPLTAALEAGQLSQEIALAYDYFTRSFKRGVV